MDYKLGMIPRCFRLLRGIRGRIRLPSGRLATLSCAEIYGLSCRCLIGARFGIVLGFFALLFSMPIRFFAFLSIIVFAIVN